MVIDSGKLILNGLILSAVSLVLRTVGVFFNAYITTEIGAVGTGVFSLVMSVYAPALTLATAGVNLAVSRLAAEELGKGNYRSVKDVLKKTVIYSTLVSGAVAILLTLLSEYISVNWLGNSSAEGLLKILASGLPFVAISSAASGYFVAVRRTTRNAAVQLFEQFFKIAVTLFVLQKAVPLGKISCLCAVILCSVISDIVSCFLILFLCRRDLLKLGRKGEKEKGTMGRILSVTIPVSISSFLRSGLVALEHILIPKGLKKSGVSYEKAMASYGTLSGMALPIILFPSSFLYSFSGLLIPEFAEARERGRMKEIRLTAIRVIRTVLIFSIGAAGILLGFAYDLGMAVYKSGEAARYIAVLAPLIPVMYLDTAVDSILKGLGEQVWTMKVNIADALISVIAVMFLVPTLGIDGYIIIIFTSEIFNFVFSVYRLTLVTGLDIKFFRQSVFPIISVVAAVSAVKIIEEIVLNFDIAPALSAALGISLSAVIYFSLLILFGVVSARLPLIVGKKLISAVCGKRKEIKTKEIKQICR